MFTLECPFCGNKAEQTPESQNFIEGVVYKCITNPKHYFVVPRLVVEYLKETKKEIK